MKLKNPLLLKNNKLGKRVSIFEGTGTPKFVYTWDFMERLLFYNIEKKIDNPPLLKVTDKLFLPVKLI